jgi:hypothetical protein
MATEAPAPMPTEPISVEEALAQARLDVADQIAAEDADEATADVEAKKANAERGPDGKFKPAEAKTEAKKAKEPAEKTDEPAAAKPKEGEEPDADRAAGGLARARKLFAKGDVAEAVKLAFGVDPEDLKLNSKQWDAVKEKLSKTKNEAREAEARGQQAMAQAQQMVQRFVPLAQAAQAYAQGDYETFVRLATGDDFTTFQRKLIAQAAQTKDPAAEARIARLEQTIAQRDAENARLQQMTAQQQQAQAVRKHVSELASELKDCGDPRFEAAAGKQLFLDKVLEIQREHWNKRDQTTLPPLEAAELAWEELYGDLLEVRTERGGVRGSPERGGQNHGTPGRSGPNSARVTAKAGTNLRHSQAAEAAPEDDLEGDELMQHFIRKAVSAQRATG